MGYDSWLSEDDFTITPPLSPDAVHAIEAGRRDFPPWTFDSQGIYAPEESTRISDYEYTLESLVAAIMAHGSVVTGKCDCEGEENDDFCILGCDERGVWIQQGYRAYHPKKLLTPD